MARPVRVDVQDGWYHVMARGTERRTLFVEDRYSEHFLDLLAAMSERYAVQVHAYVLMGNHYHLLVRTPEANASRAIQWLNVSFSAWFNRKRDRVGHVFQGRFKSVLIENNGAWLMPASAYLHLNPVRVTGLGLGKAANRAESHGLVEPDRMEVKKRLEVLRKSRWNSYPAYAGYREAPDWLVTRNLLARAGGREAYRRYVESFVTRGLDPAEFETLTGKLVLGGTAFQQRVKSLAGKMSKEQPDRRQLARNVNFKTIVKLVEDAKGEPWAAFRDRHGDWGRDLVLYVARRRSGLTLREIGALAGGMEYKTVSKAIQYFQRRLTEDKSAQLMTKAVISQLSNIET